VAIAPPPLTASRRLCRLSCAPQRPHRTLKVQFAGLGLLNHAVEVAAQIRIDNVELSIDDGERHHVDNTSVDHEIFFFSKGKDGYLVSTLLPPVPDRADNFTWLNSWLSGLQIPIY
jgi:hypothetical protein